jgi:hypothetical protein
MKILIQSESTGLYWGVHARWVGKRAKHMKFKGVLNALQYCFSKDFRGVRLLFCFKNKAFDFFVSPFEPNTAEFPYRAEFRTSVLKLAENLRIKEEQLTLREELNKLVEDGKARRRNNSRKAAHFENLKRRAA